MVCTGVSTASPSSAPRWCSSSGSPCRSTSSRRSPSGSRSRSSRDGSTRASRRSSARPSSRWTRCSATAARTGGQVGLGWLSQTFSIPLAWLVGGAVQVARRAAVRGGAARGAGGARGRSGRHGSPVLRGWSPRAASARAGRRLRLVGGPDAAPAAPTSGPSGERAA